MWSATDPWWNAWSAGQRLSSKWKMENDIWKINLSLSTVEFWMRDSSSASLPNLWEFNKACSSRIRASSSQSLHQFARRKLTASCVTDYTLSAWTIQLDSRGCCAHIFQVLSGVKSLPPLAVPNSRARTLTNALLSPGSAESTEYQFNQRSRLRQSAIAST